MKTKTTLILLVVFSIFLLVAVLVNRAGDERSKNLVEGKPLFPDLTPDKASRIELSGLDTNVVISKKKGEWVVETSEDYPADPAGVDAILEKTSSYLRKDVVSRLESKHGLFEVDQDKAVRVRILGDQDTTLADFYVGKVGSDFRSTFVRLEGSNDVLSVPESIRSTYYRGKRTWRDRTVFDFAQENIRKIEINAEDEAYTLESPDGQAWTLLTPQGQYPAKKNLVTNLASNFSKLLADNWPDKQGQESLKEYGLDPEQARAVAVEEDGTSHTLLFGMEDDKNQSYVKRPDKDTVFLVGKYRRNNILRKSAELKETPPASPAPAPK